MSLSGLSGVPSYEHRVWPLAARRVKRLKWALLGGYMRKQCTPDAKDFLEHPMWSLHLAV
jgi:hypothetical protein